MKINEKSNSYSVRMINSKNFISCILRDKSNFRSYIKSIFYLFILNIQPRFKQLLEFLVHETMQLMFFFNYSYRIYKILIIT